MANVNIFIGGTGVNSAVLMKRRADFYKYKIGPLSALDTEPNQQGYARPILGEDGLIVTAAGFANRMQRYAAELRTVSWEKMWATDAPFSLAVLHDGATTISRNLDSEGGLYQLRAGGWLALKDLREYRQSNFLVRLANNVGKAAQDAAQAGLDQTVTIHFVVSIAGGTGSGLFIPLMAALRANLDQRHVANYSTQLTVITASPFVSSWHDTDIATLLTTRGESGAFAAFREIQWLVRKPDEYARPEARRVMDYDLAHDARPAFAHINWLGKREVDANRPPNDAYFEASRILALLNDDEFAALVQPLGQQPHQRMPSFASVEYPRLERAQILASEATLSLITTMRGPGGDPSRSVLDARPTAPREGGDQARALRGALLDFVRVNRREPGVLSTPAKAASDLIPQATALALRDAIHRSSGGTLTSGIRGVRVGNLLTAGIYGRSESDWVDYVGALVAALERQGSQDVANTTAILGDVKEEAINYVIEAAAAAIGDTPDTVTPKVPALATVRDRLVALTRDLYAAKLFFGRPGGVKARITTPTRNGLKDVGAQKAERDRLKTRLSEQMHDEAPKGWQFSLFVSLPFLLVGVLFLFAIALRYISPGPGFLGLVIPGFTPTTEELLVVMIVALMTFAGHMWWRSRNWNTIVKQRRARERELIAAWDWLITCDHVEQIWTTMEEICTELIGDPPPLQSGYPAAPARASALGGVFDDLTQMDSWLSDCAMEENGRVNRGPDIPPHVLFQVGSVQKLTPAAQRRVWPDVRSEGLVDRTSMTRRLADVRLTPPNEAGVLSADLRRRLTERNTTKEEQARLRDTRNAFLASLEETIQQAIGESDLLPRTFNEVAGSDVQTMTTAAMAATLNNLAGRVESRGAPGELRPSPTATSTFLVVPDPQTERRVRDAVDFAGAHGGTYGRLDTLVSRLPQGRPYTQSANVGQAIAIVQFWHFAWPGQEGSQFEDFESARLTHYAVEGRPGGDPVVHNDYNATNTEFYLLPELSAAARIEALAKMHEPLPSILVQRLYGSTPEDGDVPALIDLFYLARHLDMLQTVTSLTQQPQSGQVAARAAEAVGDESDDDLYVRRPGTSRSAAASTTSAQAPTVSWYLLPGKQRDGRRLDEAQLSRTAFPLVQYAKLGSPPVEDPLGLAREQFIVLDAFIAAMGFHGGLNPQDDFPVFDGPRRGTMLGEDWADNRVRQRLDDARQYLLSHWWDLSATGRVQSTDSDGSHNAGDMLTAVADGVATYRRMAALVEADVQLLPAPLKTPWRRICSVIFRRSLENLHHDSQALVSL